MANKNHSDVLIIGGGICGVATAFHLAQLGAQVTLLERGTLASEASGVNAGGLGGFGWGDSPDLQSYLTAGSFEIFQSLELDMGYDIEFQAQGSLIAIHTVEQWDYAIKRVSNLQSNGYHAELLTCHEGRAIEQNASEKLAGFMYLPDRARVNPIKATLAFGQAASYLKANIRTGHNVLAINQRGSSWQIESNQETFTAMTLVLAGGAWSRSMGDLVGINIPVEPIRGQMWATNPIPPSIFHLSGSMESPFDWSRQSPNPNYPPELTHRSEKRITRHLYGGQTKNGEVIFGGDRQMVGYNYIPQATGIKVNREQATEVFPFLERLPITRTWAGLMPFSMDGKPIIGQISQLLNLFIVTGLASSGFGRGPMAGKLLADFIHQHEPAPVLSEANPDRCITLKQE